MEEQDFREIVLKGERIEFMCETEGWKDFEKQMMLRLAMHGSVLQKTNDEKEVFRTQGRMQELNALLSYVNAVRQDKKDTIELMERGEEDATRTRIRGRASPI